MGNKDVLINRYKTNYDAAMRFINQDNLIEAKACLKKSLESAIQIVQSTYGGEKDSFKAKAMKVAELIEKIDEKLNAKPAPTLNATPKAATAHNSAPAAPSEDGINYVINGIDVKGFLSTEANDPVTFEDVKGMESEKALIKREFFLTDAQRAFNERLGKKPKTFILLYGVPGTGKTFFAKAISEELKIRLGGNVPFFSVVGGQLSDCKVGATEKNIQAIFDFCKQFEHCVLFIDEFDTLAPDRKQSSGDPTAETRVTTLLQMMDGFSSSKGTLVIAATNCPYNLDGAVLSRANTRIEIPLPSYEVIYAVIHSKIADMVADDVDLATLAARLEDGGYSNRDIKNFIENMKDSLSDEFSAAEERGEVASEEDFNTFRYTNAIIEKAFREQPPSTKKSDMERIEQFKRSGE